MNRSDLFRVPGISWVGPPSSPLILKNDLPDDRQHDLLEKAVPEFEKPAYYLDLIQLPRRVVFHCTPKHAGWPNMAEIEIALGRQCLNRRICDQKLLAKELAAGHDGATSSTEPSGRHLPVKARIGREPRLDGQAICRFRRV